MGSKKEKLLPKKDAILKRKSKASKKEIKNKLFEKPKKIAFPSDWSNCDPEDLNEPSLYINRDLSLLQFNQRVLEQAYNQNHPLLERVKFFAIVGSNLDEFFMIRVATILKRTRASRESISFDGLNSTEQFWAIRTRVKKMMEAQKDCWDKILRPLLEKEAIEFLELSDYTPKINKYLAAYFKKEIYPTLTPLAFDRGHPFPHISNLSLNFAVVIEHKEQVKFACVKIPAILPRFIPIPDKSNSKTRFVFLEDVVRANMLELFPDTEIEEIYLFRVIRDTDVEIEEDEEMDLLETVNQGLRQIRYGDISHLKVETEMPQKVLDILIENFQVPEDAITRTTDRMGFADWMDLAAINRPRLKNPLLTSPTLFSYEGEPQSIFDRIKDKDYLTHHPYDSFTSIESFLKAAVNDPQVVAIKITLYRVDGHSPVVELLTQARALGKQVAVLVELRARFDEKSNILWAKQMESVGVNLVYGLVNLKTHCKLCLIVRREATGIQRYVHIGTGNYNRETARIYTDLGIFTADEAIAEDVSQVFNYLTGYSNKKNYLQLLVAPVNLRSKLMKLIAREVEQAKVGKPARLIFKINHLADPHIIQTLYRASQAGVTIDLIVRGVCCLRPRIPGISDNIRVISIIGQFLEHSRIYYFQNAGKEEFYIGSADLMERNLDRRVEVVAPVSSKKIKLYLKTQILEIMLNDNQQACDLQTNGEYTPVSQPQKTPLSTHLYLLEQHASKRN